MSVSLIRQSEDLTFVYKKTEQVATATYMVASLMSKADPMSDELKKLSITLTRLVSLFAGSDSELPILADLKSSLVHLASLLDVSFSARIMSPMNHRILKAEIDILVGKIFDCEKDYRGASPFTSVFKNISNLGTFANEDIRTSSDNKGHEGLIKDISAVRGTIDQSVGLQKSAYAINVRDRVLPKRATDSFKKDNNTGAFPVRTGNDLRKENRKNIILNTIQKKGSVTIKDISAVVRDCSEKTIQRELLALVSEHVLVKEGERRWSVYSFPKTL